MTPRRIALLALLVSGCVVDRGSQRGAVFAARPADITTHVAFLAAAESHDDERVGDGGDFKTATYSAYEALRNEASPAQLRALTHHEAPCVRLYALEALMERGIDTQDRVVELLEDETELRHWSGCSIMAWPLGDLILFASWDRLDAEHRCRVTDRLLLRPTGLYGRRWIMENKAIDAYEDAVRRLAHEGVPGALVGLARLRRPQDAGLILFKLLVHLPEDRYDRHEVFRALQVWPMAEALPRLCQLMSEETRYYEVEYIARALWP